MRMLLLSSFSILGGLATILAQNWVPYGFYNFKQSSQPSPVQESQGLLIVESTASIMTDYEASQEMYYANPDIAYSTKEQSKNPPHNPQPAYSSTSHLCDRQWWLNGDYLLAWMKKEDVDAPLITTGSAIDVIPGAVGQPNTRVVYGNEHINFHRFQGVRGGIGTYLNPYKSFSIDVDGFWIFSKTNHFKISSDAVGDPLIARPFFDVRLAEENAELVSNPGFFSGTSSALAKSQLWGAEVNLGYHPCKKAMTGDIFVGFRFLRLREKLKISDHMNPIVSPSGLSFNGATNEINPPDTLKDEDLFQTNNKFYGGQLGVRAEFANNWFFFNFFGKVALGATNEDYRTQGSTTWKSTEFGNQYASGGVLVQPNNMVHRQKSVFAWVPEVGVNIGFEPFNHFRFLVGYSFLWWNKVLRPGEQINRDVNSGQIPGNAAFFTPAAQTPNDHVHNVSFWLQTLNFGLTLEF